MATPADSSEPPPPGARLWVRRARALGLAVLFVAVLAQMIALSPKLLEVASDAEEQLEPEEVLVVTSPRAVLAQGVPRDRIPDYTLESFRYTSTERGEPRWRIVADRAFVFNLEERPGTLKPEQLVHALVVRAQILNADGSVTRVTGKEAKYFMSQGNLEMWGEVTMTFPDGFRVQSEYAYYRTETRKLEVPTSNIVHGDGLSESRDELKFTSHGLDYDMNTGLAILPSQVHVTAIEPARTAQAKPNPTDIYSDRCVIQRPTRLATFTMRADREIRERFVRIEQPGMTAKGRRVEMTYGPEPSVKPRSGLVQRATPPPSSTSGNRIRSLTAFDDVTLRDTGLNTPPGETPQIRYGTGGRADFDTRRNRITLREFPQVYQNNDTVTGDVIIVHRETDVVEVERSNAFSEGLEQPKSKPRSDASGRPTL